MVHLVVARVRLPGGGALLDGAIGGADFPSHLIAGFPPPSGAVRTSDLLLRDCVRPDGGGVRCRPLVCAGAVCGSGKSPDPLRGVFPGGSCNRGKWFQGKPVDVGRIALAPLGLVDGSRPRILCRCHRDLPYSDSSIGQRRLSADLDADSWRNRLRALLRHDFVCIGGAVSSIRNPAQRDHEQPERQCLRDISCSLWVRYLVAIPDIGVCASRRSEGAYGVRRRNGLELVAGGRAQAHPGSRARDLVPESTPRRSFTEWNLKPAEFTSTPGTPLSATIPTPITAVC